MCTAFPYCRVGVQRLLEVIHAIIFTGGIWPDPRTLRPERLQWLTTSAANISNRAIWGSGRIGLVAHKRCVSRPVSGSFSFPKILSRAWNRKGPSLLFSQSWKAGRP